MSQQHLPGTSTPTDPSIDQLTSELAITSIAHDINGQWVSFPPGTSIEEQLLILAGVEDYTLNGSPEQNFSAAEIARSPNPTTSHAASVHAFDAKDAMARHLAMLEDTELASLMHTNLHLTAPAPPRTPPSSPPFAGYQASYPPGSLSDLESMYTRALAQCKAADALADAPLPASIDELAELSTFMQRQIWWMVADGDLTGLVKSPKAHPLYPYWVLPGIGERGRGEGEEGGGVEMEMEMGM